ncbi:MAG: hypothetical protein ACLF0P_01575 [Thermoanaerobaculia bacterium]
MIAGKSLPLFALTSAGALALAGQLVAPAPAAAQGCATERTEPIVCSVELVVFRSGEWRGEALDGSTLRLATRSQVEIEARALDQHDQRFPPDRLRYVLDLDSRCDDLLDAEKDDDGTLRLATGSRTGGCDAFLWLPNDLNHDRELRILVDRPERQSYSREEAELLATWLYRAALGREPNEQGLQSATGEIQKGNLGSLVRSVVGSPEFQRRRSELRAGALLESFYKGLFDREPGIGAVRAHLRSVERGAYADVLWNLIRSDELEARLERTLDSP